MSIEQMEALDFRYLLLEYYKKLGISENELAVLLMVDHLKEQKNTFVTPDLLSMKMNISLKELDKIFAKLVKDGLLTFETGKKIKVSLKPLKKKLYDAFQLSLAKEHEIAVSEEKSSSVKRIIEVYEKELGRSLSPLEQSLISDWIEQRFTADEIINALKDCLLKGKKTLRSVDRVLLTWRAQSDLDKNGVTAVSDDWDKDIEKTMEIAKAKWIK